VEDFADVRFGAQSAAELTGYAGRPEDSADHVAIDGMALLGTVEIHEVEAFGPLLGPAPGDGDGVIAEDGLLRVITLAQADAASAPDVNGRVNLHATPRSKHPPARRLDELGTGNHPRNSAIVSVSAPECKRSER